MDITIATVLQVIYYTLLIVGTGYSVSKSIAWVVKNVMDGFTKALSTQTTMSVELVKEAVVQDRRLAQQDKSQMEMRKRVEMIEADIAKISGGLMEMKTAVTTAINDFQTQMNNRIDGLYQAVVKD